ncbi:MAG TPA: hypothetical protein VNM47_06025 [Terriglobia bacterium]|nr:hypothetical protein [Terriglobia bacterium]
MRLRRRYWNWRRRVWGKRFWEASKALALCPHPPDERGHQIYKLEYARRKKLVAEDRYWAAVTRETVKRLKVNLDTIMASWEGSRSDFKESTVWADCPPVRRFVPPGSEDPPTELAVAPPATR